MYKCQKKHGTTANTTTHNSKLVEMPKLNFRYGVMNSAKTAELLMMVHNMESKGKAVVVIKPGVDTRNACIQSRLGMTRVPDIVALEDSDVHAIVMLMMAVSPNVSAVFVDEAQFLTAAHVEQLRELSIEVNVFCYGLRTDYRGVLFAGSKRLIWRHSSAPIEPPAPVTSTRLPRRNAPIPARSSSIASRPRRSSIVTSRLRVRFTTPSRIS